MRLQKIGALMVLILCSMQGRGQSTEVYQFSADSYSANGNLLTYSDKINGTWTATYDNLNRLHTAVASAGPYSGASLTWEYDSFGNRKHQSVSGGSNVAPQDISTDVNADNRLASINNGVVINDETGNLRTDGRYIFAYDAESRVCAVYDSIITGNVTQYLYDASGRRVAKGHPTQPTTIPTCTTGIGFVPSEKYILDQAGEQVTQLDSSDQWQHTNIFADGRLLATYDNQNTQGPLHFNITDPLGTKRIQTTALGEPELSCLSLPFGDGPVCSGAVAEATRHRLTGKERDTESGLDYFGARYYSSNMGRFSSADNGEDQDMQNPQSWNLYSYVQNNPLTNTDPDGHDCINTSNYATDGTATITTGTACASDPGKYGTYVNGTIDQNSITASSKPSGTDFGYNFTSYDGQSGGAGVITKADTYGPFDGPANRAASGMIGNGGMQAIGVFTAGSVVGGVAGGLALGAIGTEATLSILTENLEGVLSRAGSAVGNHGAKVASREVAEEAAKKWVGDGARELTDRGTGKVIGEISADGTKVARFTSAETKGYINLVNKLTGGNLHVGW